MLIEQKFLGRKGLIFFIFLLNMTAPMSTDMYLPAFPLLLKEFNTTSAYLNYSLVGFFISFALGMLFIGPISDKLGRKPILITGIIVYSISSILCSLASTVDQLIIFRISQAIGAGGMVSVSTAIVKDSFSNESRPKIIATLQMLGAFAPTVAPLIGAQIIKHYNWQLTFDVLSLISLLSLVFAILMTETHQQHYRLKGNVFQSIISLKDIIVNKPFMLFLLAMAGPSLIYMSFLAISSYIYIDWFQLTETQYSIFFAVNSLVLILGPRLYLFLKDKISPNYIIRTAITLISISGILLISIGKISPYVFLITFFPITIGAGFLRSFSTNILLAQKNMNAGGAASIINFTNTALGSLGMFLGTIGWSNYIFGIGSIALFGMTFTGILWRMFKFKKYSLEGIN